MSHGDNRCTQEREGETLTKTISCSNSEDQNIKLHKSPNPWRPLHKCKTPLNEKTKLKRAVLGVLNKLTPQKFVTLLSQIKELKIDTEEKLALVIDLIFEKAIDEPNFSVPYANLCKHLAFVKVPVSGTGKQVNFRKLLLTKCQMEFEQDRRDELKNEEKMKTLEAADVDKRKELELEYEEEEKKIMFRQLGNIRFIGELFKLGMLIEPIVHECIKRLLSQGDEESLKCLCLLLKTLGKELDDGKPPKNSRDNPMDMYFGQMKLIIDKRLTSSRVRFMLQDVIDLRKNNWVPRRDENNPKTIYQIRKEAEYKAREQQKVYQNMWNYRKRMSGGKDLRKNSGRMDPSADDLSSKNSKSSNSMLGASKLKSTELDEAKSIIICPGIKGIQSCGTIRISRIDPDNSTNIVREEDYMQTQPTSLTKESPPNKEFEEAIKCVIKLASPNTVPIFINGAINQGLEQSSPARYSLGQLLISLLKEKIITFEQYKNGFSPALQVNYALDIPLIWDYMGEILEPLIEEIGTPIKLLKEVLQPCIPSEKAGMLVSSILHCAAKRMGMIKVGKAWIESGVKWADIIGTDRNEAEFIQKHKLEFTMSPMKINPQIWTTMEEMKYPLFKLLEKDSELEEIFEWIDANVSDTTSPTFVRALVTAVLESCLSGSVTTWELNTSKLKSRILLIRRYISTHKNLQLQVLDAVQALVHQLGNPNHLLHKIFGILSDADVISDVSFLEWHKRNGHIEA